MAEEQQAQAPENPISFHAQYIKDLSFENPNAPASVALQAQPKIDINVDVEARKGGADDSPMHEVTIKLRVEAKAEMDGNERTTFLAELDYSGLVTLNGVPEEHKLPVLLIEVPRLLFPYARKILSDLTSDGGFPPLMLHPIDFASLFRNKYMQGQGGEGAAVPGEGAEAPAQGNA